ncbi:MAG TPA: tRNA 2-thiouridine(34) synthase MnmA [Bdellovibrionota bacterium]|nr:tRNA 2-thiouridine(34) synthase MnmA [Bdellovibrionota bacterium]
MSELLDLLQTPELRAMVDAAAVPAPGTRVVVAMSGGVDSSVAAAVLRARGLDVVGIALQTTDYSKYLGDDSGGSCCSSKDMEDARRVSERLGIPFYVLGTEATFDANVVDYFVDEYLGGRTPNPCVMCNTRVKFNHLYKKAMNLGADCVATGHFARVECDETVGYQLVVGSDAKKDQSYFLFNLNQTQLSRTCFPVGHLTKPQVRQLGEAFGLLTAQKKESQEICFVPSNDYKEFIAGRVDSAQMKTGFVATLDGKPLCRHDGIHHFTLGQRKGLAKPFEAAQKAGLDVTDLFVVDIDPVNGTVYLGPASALLKTRARVRDVNWIGEDFPLGEREVQVKIRYRSAAVPARLRVEEGATVILELEAPQRAVTPGQAAVFFDGDRCLGGGWIARL